MKKVEVVLTEFQVVRIAEDADNRAFVEVYISETGQERRLYEGDVLKLEVDLGKLKLNE